MNEVILLLTIRELEIFFDGQVSYRCIDGWIRRGKLTPAGRNSSNQLLIPLPEAQRVEAESFTSKRGRPRTTRPSHLFNDAYL